MEYVMMMYITHLWGLIQLIFLLMFLLQPKYEKMLFAFPNQLNIRLLFGMEFFATLDIALETMLGLYKPHFLFLITHQVYKTQVLVFRYN